MSPLDERMAKFRDEVDAIVRRYARLEPGSDPVEIGETRGHSGHPGTTASSALAARPSQGKSSLLGDFALNVALNAKAPVALFSLEMSRHELVERFLASQAKVDSQRIHRGALEDRDWTRLSGALGRLSSAPIYIDDSGSTTVTDVRAKCRRLQTKVGLGLVIVDYLQLMPSSDRPENRQLEVSAISRGLKLLAKDLKVPVICAAQVKGAVEFRSDKRPLIRFIQTSPLGEVWFRLLLRERARGEEWSPWWELRVMPPDHVGSYLWAGSGGASFPQERKFEWRLIGTIEGGTKVDPGLCSWRSTSPATDTGVAQVGGASSDVLQARSWSRWEGWLWPCQKLAAPAEGGCPQSSNHTDHGDIESDVQAEQFETELECACEIE